MPHAEANLRLAADLRLACQQVSRRVRFEGSQELPPHQVSVLVKLLDGPRRPSELALAERVSKPSMSRTIGGLEKCGWAVISDDPDDGRQRLVSLTEQGRAALATTRAERDHWMLRSLEGLTPEQRSLLREAAELLSQMMAR